MYISLPSMLIQLTTMSENQNRPNRPRKDHPEKNTIFKMALGAKTPLEEELPTTKVKTRRALKQHGRDHHDVRDQTERRKRKLNGLMS